VRGHRYHQQLARLCAIVLNNNKPMLLRDIKSQHHLRRLAIMNDNISLDFEKIMDLFLKNYLTITSSDDISTSNQEKKVQPPRAVKIKHKENDDGEFDIKQVEKEIELKQRKMNNAMSTKEKKKKALFCDLSGISFIRKS